MFLTLGFLRLLRFPLPLLFFFFLCCAHVPFFSHASLKDKSLGKRTDFLSRKKAAAAAARVASGQTGDGVDFWHAKKARGLEKKYPPAYTGKEKKNEKCEFFFC